MRKIREDELFMHMADALVSPQVATTMYVCSTAVAGYSIHKLRLEDDSKKVPVMGVMGAFVFATQMINFTIPGTGSSGHLCGGMLLSALLGPWAGFVTMISVLLIQGLFFADGGLLALGCNVWNMAFYGCFIGSLLIWKPIMKKGASPLKITLASILGCVLTLQLGAFSVTLQTLFSNITSLPFGTFVWTMQPIHLAIGFVEGLITSAVLLFVYKTQPSLLWGVNETENNTSFTFKKTLATLSILALFIGGGLSLYASSNPDGLEWSMEKVAGTSELEYDDNVHETLGNVQEKTSFLPDYAFKDNESALGTSFSGIIGSIIVCGCSILLAKVFKMFKNKNVKETNA